MAWLLLNPGQPNPDPIQAPTMCRVICMSCIEGYSGVIVVNVYPNVTGSPIVLWATHDRLLEDVGDLKCRATNLEYVREAGERAALRIVGFGGLGGHANDPGVAAALRAFGGRPRCIGKSKRGWPRHPGARDLARRLPQLRKAKRWRPPAPRAR